MVALLSSFIFSSVSAVPSQCALTKPALLSSTFINSSQVSAFVICASLKVFGSVINIVFEFHLIIHETVFNNII